MGLEELRQDYATRRDDYNSFLYVFCKALTCYYSRIIIVTTMSTPKRQFPYYSAVPEVELKKQALENVNPGFERNEPRTFEAPASAQEPQEVWYLADQNAKKDAGC